MVVAAFYRRIRPTCKCHPEAHNILSGGSMHRRRKSNLRPSCAAVTQQRYKYAFTVPPNLPITRSSSLAQLRCKVRVSEITIRVRLYHRHSLSQVSHNYQDFFKDYLIAIMQLRKAAGYFSLVALLFSSSCLAGSEGRNNAPQKTPTACNNAPNNAPSQE